MAFALSVTPVLAQSPLRPSAYARAEGPFTITLPDGSSVSGATNQLILILTGDATGANQQAVFAVIAEARAQVVGQSQRLKLYQLQVADTKTIASLIIKLRVLPGVQWVGPVLLTSRAASSCSGDGPIPGSGMTGWVQADDLAPAAADGGDVIVAVLDDFAGQGQPPDHGDVVLAYVQDSAGKGRNGAPLFEVGRNLFKVPAGYGNLDDLDSIEQLLIANPSKRIVVNVSSYPAGCVKDSSFTAARCAAAQQQYNKGFTEGMKKLASVYGDRAIVVGIAGNGGVPVSADASMSSCQFIPVVGLDQMSPKVTLAPFTETSPAFPVAAPACNISPISLAVPSGSRFSSGTSFAAPQITGQVASVLASNAGLGPCELGKQIFALPKVSPTQPAALFKGRTLAERTAARTPVPALLTNTPGTPLACDAITVTPAQAVLKVNGTLRLTPALADPLAIPAFTYSSSNDDVAVVDPSGTVTVKSSGVATISVTAVNQFCAARAAIVVPEEIYTGTFSQTVTVTAAPDPSWSPNPLVTTATTTSAPMQLAIVQTLLSPGTATGLLTVGPGSIAVAIPSQTCVACSPPVTIPGLTQVSPLPASSGPVSGSVEGSTALFPIDGFPPLTARITTRGTSADAALTWSFTIRDPSGVTIALQMSASLTKR